MALHSLLSRAKIEYQAKQGKTMLEILENFNIEGFIDFERWLAPPILYYIIGGLAALFIVFLIVMMGRRKRYFKKTLKKFQKLRVKKFNGERLIDRIDKKRKAGSNTFKTLSASGKKRVKQYFNHKDKELIFTAIYASGSKLRYKYRNVILQVSRKKNGRLVIDDFSRTKGFKRLANKYASLDELILYLDELPIKMMDGQTFEIPLDEETKLDYTIKWPQMWSFFYSRRPSEMG